jgi:transcription elongation factor S-II
VSFIVPPNSLHRGHPIMEEIKQLKEQLAVAQSVEETLQILERLANNEITLEVLKVTQIGVAVGKLRKHEDSRVSSFSKKLVDTWKGSLPSGTQDKSQTPVQTAKSVDAKTTNPPKENSTTTVKVEKEDTKGTNGVKRSHEKPAIKEENKNNDSDSESKKRKPDSDKAKPAAKKAAPAPIRAVSTSSGDDESVRNKARVLLVESLGPKQNESDLDSMEVATSIEQSLFDTFGGVTKQYKAKFRSLSFNLKNEKNPTLRTDVLSGTISVERLCNMSAQEMASPEAQAKRKEIEKWHLEAAKIGHMEATTDMFVCGKCKQRKCTYYQLQTRSADEPMTTYVTCTNCNNRWKFC